MKIYFPWRLFRWILRQQIVISGVAFAVIAAALIFQLERAGHEREMLRAMRGQTLLALGLAFVALTLVALFVARRLVIPLGRLIEKTRRLRDGPFEPQEFDPEALTFDEPGEWYDLERAVNKLGRDLQKKTIRLSREKTELRAIMSAVSEAVLAVSKERRVLFFNSQFAYLFNPVNATVGDVRISEVLRVPDVIDVYDAVLKTGEPQRREVQVSVANERLARIFQLSVAPLRKKHNQELYGVVGIFHDITELKQAERIRIEFVGNVSHEMRTPLTAINGYLQTVCGDLKKGRTEEAQEFLGIVTGNVTRLKNLVDDLLDLSALESGKELRFESVHPQDVTEAVLSQVPAKGHRIKLHYGFEEMTGDAKRLEQVLRNLMENAVRYVPEGREIEIRWDLAPNGMRELRVKDNGPGIAAEHQSRLFERFYRVDEDRSRDKGGTGIGLALVKHIVQRHGGQVYVKSQLGKGSEFICEFPAP